MGDMRKREAVRLRTTLADPNTAQSTNRECKTDLRQSGRITKLDIKRLRFDPVETDILPRSWASQKGGSTYPVLPVPSLAGAR
jgi:hypothetical protein